MNQTKELVIEFPCEFSIKALGKQTPDLVNIVAQLVAKHVDVQSNNISTRPSKNKSYTAVTIKIIVQDRDQLDNVYRALSEHPSILMTL